jgi:hypothetical protein
MGLARKINHVWVFVGHGLTESLEWALRASRIGIAGSLGSAAAPLGRTPSRAIAARHSVCSPVDLGSIEMSLY